MRIARRCGRARRDRTCRACAFFLSRVSRSENRQRRGENVVVAPLSPAVSHGGSLRLPDLLRVARSRRTRHSRTERSRGGFPYAMPLDFVSIPGCSPGTLEELVSIFVLECVRGRTHQRVPTTCFPSLDKAT